MSTKMNRRTFIVRAAAGVGATCLACAGLTAIGLQAPVNPSYQLFASGEQPVNQKVLVTYASRAGSTMEVAQAVAEELTKRGFAVDVLPVKQASSVDGYGAVVIGSAVRMGSWLPDAVKFVEKNSAALQQKKTAFFGLYLMNQGEDEASRTARSAYMEPARKWVKPQTEGLFVGVGDPAKISFIERMIGKMVKSPEGDFRDWNAIRAWAQQIEI